MPSVDPRLKQIEEKWQARWTSAEIFKARADPSRPKYFVNVPYPYMNGYLHIGFGVTFLHADIMARFKRMQGHNVLFPQAFHCTGMPVLAAANLVAEGNPAQIKILADMGIPESEIPSFSDINKWTSFFPDAARKDLASYGSSVDWTRTFVTTSLNPAYDRFVRWQFRKLREMGYVKTGKHPVIWCPKDQQPVADHDRYEGEGETPVEFTLLKFRWQGRFLVAATLRPETVYGQTNLWVDPDATYVAARIDGEEWILSRSAAEKLKEQDRHVELLEEVKGELIVGGQCEAPMIHHQIPIFPTRFIDHTKGTGIVTSVPSDAPDDWIALKTLWEDAEYAHKHALNLEDIRKVKPIPIIRTEGWGPLPAVEICEKLGIKSLDEKEKLEKAKEEVYSSGFYRGVMLEVCGRFAGMHVAEAKEEIKREMIKAGEASTLWEASGEVICRCRTRAAVKVVTDQWFLTYGDPEWKTRTSDALGQMTLFPDTVRKQFEHVLAWLNDWACTHHAGLGTKLPWDERWVIESLSDSTIYMAYYTIAHLASDPDLDPSSLTDEVFNYAFLDEGSLEDASKKSGLPAETIGEMRREFEYWYPFDLRHTAKDLVQNHMAFCLFNHTAMFPEKYWPRGFGVNGFVKIGHVRMSKSHGVALYLRDLIREHGADIVRLACAQGGEGLDDPSYDDEFAFSAGKRLLAFIDYAKEKHETRSEWRELDAWFRSVMHRTIRLTAKAMEGMWHRTAIKLCYFDLQRQWAWYLKRCGGRPNANVLREFLDVETRLIAPFIPHAAEEIWEATGHKGFVSTAQYPEVDVSAINAAAEFTEEYIRQIVEDTREIFRVTGITPSKVTVFTAPTWKRRVYEMAVDVSLRGSADMGDFMRQALQSPELKARSKELAAFVQKILENLRKMAHENLELRKNTLDETALLNESKEFLQSELGCAVVALDAETPGVVDTKRKAAQSIPWKPAIFIE